MSTLDDLEFKIARLDLRPGDVLVARFKERLQNSQVARIQETFQRTCPGIKCLVLENGADLAILTAAEIEARSATPRTDFPKPETMLAYASILEKPQYYIHNERKYLMPRSEIIDASIAALRFCASPPTPQSKEDAA